MIAFGLGAKHGVPGGALGEGHAKVLTVRPPPPPPMLPPCQSRWSVSTLPLPPKLPPLMLIAAAWKDELTWSEPATTLKAPPKPLLLMAKTLAPLTRTVPPPVKLLLLKSPPWNSTVAPLSVW